MSSVPGCDEKKMLCLMKTWLRLSSVICGRNEWSETDHRRRSGSPRAYLSSNSVSRPPAARLVEAIAHGVIVHLRAHHSCTQCRGVREMGARTRTIERRGAYVSNHHLIENCTRLFYGD